MNFFALDVVPCTIWYVLLQDWSAEGYQLWLVNSSVRQAKKSADPEFMPFPEAFNKETDEDKDVKDDREGGFECLKNRALVLQFVKSPMSVNPCMSKQTNIYLQVGSEND